MKETEFHFYCEQAELTFVINITFTVENICNGGK